MAEDMDNGAGCEDVDASHVASSDCVEIFARAVAAENLAVADRHILCKYRSSDPYVEIKFKNERFLSPIVAKSLNPTWNMEKVRLGVAQRTDTSIIQFNVWDHDNNDSDDFLGCVEMPVMAICQKDREAQLYTLPLIDSSDPEIRKIKRVRISGTITVEIEINSVASYMADE